MTASTGDPKQDRCPLVVGVSCLESACDARCQFDASTGDTGPTRDERRALAEAATEFCRSWLPYFTVHGDPMLVPVDKPYPGGRIADISVSPSDYGKAICEHLGACSPDVILADLDELEALRAENERLRQHLDGIDGENDILEQLVDGFGNENEGARALLAEWEAIDNSGAIGWAASDEDDDRLAALRARTASFLHPTLEPPEETQP